MSHHTASPCGAIEDQKLRRSLRVKLRCPPCSEGRKVRIKGRGSRWIISGRFVGSSSRQSRRSSIKSAHAVARSHAVSRSFSQTGTQTWVVFLIFAKDFRG